MLKIDYEKYYDKIYGCYLGVSIGGLLGAPYEGAKEIIDVPPDFSLIDNMLFNDDLDLQVLFFQAVEKFGMRFNSNMLAKLFSARCPYSPGEYAFFKKNYARGILPPVSGSFNNEFYGEGMGCCIRGELWGCLFPDNPALAEKYARYDGSMDHSEESIYSEYFVASLISYGFALTDMNEILEAARKRIPEGSRFRRMLDAVYAWCDEISDADALRKRIVREFGHPDCTNVFQNLAFIVVGLKLYFDDFETLIEKTIRFGFDTDCTGGIVAAVWGVVHGAEAIKNKYGVGDVKLVLGVDCPDYGGKVSSFARAVADIGAIFNDGCGGTEIVGAPLSGRGFKNSVLYELVDYLPELNIGETSSVRIKAFVPDGKKGKFTYKNDFLNVVSFSVRQGENTGESIIDISVTLPDSDTIPATACGRLAFETENGIDEDDCIPLGFALPCPLGVFDPVFDTSEHIAFRVGKNYYGHFAGISDENERFDKIRDYHLNYVVPKTTDETTKKLSSGEDMPHETVYAFRDKLRTDELTGYRGPCVLYIRRTLVFEEDCEKSVWCGCEGRAEVWLNGKKIAENVKETFFTYENLHINGARMRKGENYLVFKIERKTGREVFSCNILEKGGVMDFPEHALDYKQHRRKNNGGV